MKTDLERKPAKKKVNTDSEGFYELCDYVEKQIIYDSLTKDMKKLLKDLKAKTYDYPFILQTFKCYHTDIEKGIQRNKPFETTYNKCQYVCGIVKKKLPEMGYRIRQQKKADEKLMNMDFSKLNDTGASYQRKTKDISSKHDDLW